MYYEIRRERAKPGRGADLARWMDAVVIPVHLEAGMDVVGSFVDRNDEEEFVWIRRFASDEERERVVEAAHAHPRFAAEIEPLASELFDREAETTRLIPEP
jgi:NIPSNAP